MRAYRFFGRLGAILDTRCFTSEHYFSGQDSNLIIIVHLIDQTATTFRLNDFIIQGISDNIHSLLNQKIVAQYLHFLQIKSAGYNIFKVTYCVRVKRFHRLK